VKYFIRSDQFQVAQHKSGSPELPQSQVLAGAGWTTIWTLDGLPRVSTGSGWALTNHNAPSTRIRTRTP
jgi:hypothetical protein